MNRPTPLALLAALCLAAPALAKPVHKQALAAHYGPALDRRLVDCRTCHLPGDDPDDKPHNPFGARLKAVRQELARAGKPTDLAARLDAIADEDSDSDKVPNLLELFAGRSPGDAKDTPTPAEIDKARAVLETWQRAKREYAWRPFEPVRRPSVPAGPSHPVDAFVSAELTKRNLTPRPEAPRHVLMRRLFLDLTGLPPTPAEQDAFLSDNSPDAYERLVERLLASPRYGERWGRHWMDVWRYSDWAGYGAEVRESQPHVWRWRDWIVEALNADVGYERMVVAMLAGDESEPDNLDTLRATGFLARNWYIFNRNTWLDNTVEHTAKAFLGLTLNCARCHDHFYDAISQKEYYQFRAVFEPYAVRTDRLRGEPDRKKAGVVRVYDAFPEAKTHLFVRGNEAEPVKDQPLMPAFPSALGGGPIAPTPLTLPEAAYCPDKRPFVVRETVAAAEAAVDAALAKNDPLEIAVALARLDALDAVLCVERLEDAGKKDSESWRKAATKAAALQKTQAVAEGRKAVADAKKAAASADAKKKAEADKKVADAEAALKKAEEAARVAPTTAYTPRPLTYPRARMSYGEAESNTPYPKVSTGRRLALARWIADKNNPLTARVAVNHLWARHFGQALVPTMFDFGRNGKPPSHPALLDWLADEFVRSGWSMKAMHRLLVTSAAYKRSSTPEPTSLAADPENRWLWRVAPRRLEAEAVRDAVLSAAGGLDSTMGGPDLDYTLGLATPRRSLYFRHAAEKQMEFLKIFDAASVTECYRRNESVVPQQALALANSPLVLTQARLLARRLSDEGRAGRDFVRLGYRTLLAREPTSDEVAECLTFLTEQAKLLRDRTRLTTYATAAGGSVAASADPELRAREDLVQVLMNHNEFVTIR